MNFKQRLVTISLLLVSATAFSASQYSYQAASAGHTGYYEMQTNPEMYHILWQRFVGSEDVKAEFPRGSSVYNGIAYYTFIEVLNKSHDGSRLNKRIIAVDTETGETLWKKDEKGEGLIEAPLIGNGKLFFSVGNNQFNRTEAVDPKTGEIQYSIADTGEYIPYGSSLYSLDSGVMAQYLQVDGSPEWLVEAGKGERHFALDNDYIVLRSARNAVTAFNRKDGSEAFSVTIPDVFSFNTIDRQLVLDEKTNTVYTPFSASRDQWTASLYAIDLNQRVVRWRVPGQSNNAQPVVAGNYVFSQSSDYVKPVHISAINAVTGKVEWTWAPPEDDSIISSLPVATSDVLFIDGEKRTYAVSITTHEVVWQTEVTGRLSLGDDKLFILSKRPGSLQAYDYLTVIGLN